MEVKEKMEQSNLKWGQFKFRMKWDRKSPPELPKDLLVLDLIVAPIIEKYKKEGYIKFWRCHRRAVPDDDGHQFSIYVYTSPETSQKIKEEIEDNKIYKDLLKEGHFEKALDHKIEGESPEYLSDNTWHPFIGKTWPHFIQGTTEMLLDLIREIKGYLMSKGELKEGNLEGNICDYYKIDYYVAKLWSNHFQNAFAHHLYAIFGYNPMLVYWNI